MTIWEAFTMRITLFAGLASLLFCAQAAAQPPEPEGDSVGGRELAESSANLDFIIVNKTGQTIVELNISPRGEESWSVNLLHQRGPAGRARRRLLLARRRALPLGHPRHL
jgi:hypothetical protein